MTGLTTLHRIISDVLRIPPEKITPQSRIHDVDTWNSLTHIEFVVTIEEKFRIQLTEDEIASMTSIEQVQDVLRARGVL
jgi:acyl carrier protein